MIEKMKMLHIVASASGKEEMLKDLRDMGLLHLAEKQSASRELNEEFQTLSKASNVLNEYADPKAKEKKAMQQELFVSLTTEEQAIVNTLKTADDMPINQIVSATGISYSSVSVLLFEMENKGLVEFLGSTRYRLLRKDV